MDNVVTNEVTIDMSLAVGDTILEILGRIFGFLFDLAFPIMGFNISFGQLFAFMALILICFRLIGELLGNDTNDVDGFTDSSASGD